MAIQSSSMTHMKVLLKKDRLTLKRNWSFLVSFVLMPLFLMGFFSFLYNKVSGAKEEEKHNFNCKFLATVKSFVQIVSDLARFVLICVILNFLCFPLRHGLDKAGPPLPTISE